MAYRIYSVEDDKDIARIIQLTLRKQGYEVQSFPDGASFFKAFAEKKPDLILLDLMLPDMDGFDLLKKVREDEGNNDIQIMIVSAKSQVADKVDGLDLGADDYLEKPFEILELESRVNAKFRRFQKSQIVRIGATVIDKVRRVCSVKGKEVSLTNTEFEILYLLMKQSDAVVSRDELLSDLWGENGNYESRTIDVHVNGLRSKLGDEAYHIVSVYGIGYRYLP
jgi:two-component system alkaline phosphatase synthesis response regulator PhoP